MSAGMLIHLPEADLIELQAHVKEALKTCAAVGQSYSVNGRTYTHADLGKLAQLLGEISFALESKRGNTVTRTHASFS